MEERSSSADSQSVLGPRSDERRYEPSNILFSGRVSNGASGSLIRNGPLFLQGSSSNNALLDLNPNVGYAGGSSSAVHGTGAVLGPNFFNSGGLEMEKESSSVSSDDVGPSGTSGYTLEETSGGPGSLGGWGLSCKRKALEGTSGNSCPGGSSSCFPQADNGSWHTGTTHHNASSSLTLSLPLRNSPSISPPELSSTRIGFSMRTVASDAFPSSSVTGNEDHLRNFGWRVNPGHQQEPLAFNLSTTGGTRHSNIWSTHQSPRPASYSDALDFRSMLAPSATPGLSHPMRSSSTSRNMHPFPWNGSSNSRGINSSSSLIRGESSAALQEDVNLRSMSRNSAEHPMFVPTTEMRNIGQDPAGWSLATGNRSTSASASSSRIGPSLSIHPLAAPPWLPHQNPITHNQQRFSEFAPWSLFPPVDSESGSHNGHFSPISSGPSVSSPLETAMSPGSSGQSHNQSFPRSAFLMEGQGDDILGMPRSLRALAADIEGRHRLISEIRQVLNAMRRGESLRIEDYMLFDPFIHHGMAEMHDRHRDMRLDVDNMSYEELLALEERIGDVSTGLSEGTIFKLMKQQKYMSMMTESPADLEPCCICQEQYTDGDDIGTLDCGHNFHINCIKQWLMLKNLCPICKMTALPT
ncbi:E3 ubiquitin-protein ligase MBR2 isoform X2 [Jatropha curcas]|nr:E3 ubiquitin-protein ligase MBR2 isoform X2 [Jatropha curcas]